MGVCLINKPEVLVDMIQQVHARVPDPHFTVSIKIRLHHDLRYDLNKYTAFFLLFLISGLAYQQRGLSLVVIIVADSAGPPPLLIPA